MNIARITRWAGLLRFRAAHTCLDIAVFSEHQCTTPASANPLRDALLRLTSYDPSLLLATSGNRCCFMR